MNCKIAERQMALAVGEDLSPAESQELQGHLQACSKCQKTWAQQRHGFAILQHSRVQDVQRKSESVWPMLANRLRERAAESPRGEFNGWFAGLAVTAACVQATQAKSEAKNARASCPKAKRTDSTMLLRRFRGTSSP